MTKLPNRKASTVSEPTAGARARSDSCSCDRCDLLVGLDGFHVVAVTEHDGRRGTWLGIVGSPFAGRGVPGVGGGRAQSRPRSRLPPCGLGCCRCGSGSSAHCGRSCLWSWRSSRSPRGSQHSSGCSCRASGSSSWDCRDPPRPAPSEVLVVTHQRCSRSTCRSAARDARG